MLGWRREGPCRDSPEASSRSGRITSVSEEAADRMSSPSMTTGGNHSVKDTGVGGKRAMRIGRRRRRRGLRGLRAVAAGRNMAVRPLASTPVGGPHVLHRCPACLPSAPAPVRSPQVVPFSSRAVAPWYRPPRGLRQRPTSVQKCSASFRRSKTNLRMSSRSADLPGSGRLSRAQVVLRPRVRRGGRIGAGASFCAGSGRGDRLNEATTPKQAGRWTCMRV